MAEKRKSHTSTAVKARYNRKVYDVISVRVPKELADKFKDVCKLTNTAQAKVIKQAMQDYINSYNRPSTD